jgi:hypothetical protein
MTFYEVHGYHQVVDSVRKLAGKMALIFYCLACSLLGLTSNFHLLGVPAMNPSFADLRLITTASECLQNSLWTMISPSCDPWGRPFNYPTIWVQIFSFFGVTEANTQFIGVLEILILSSVFCYWIWKFKSFYEVGEGFIYSALIACFLLSPPILLLMERGNIDSLIFAGLTLAAIILRRHLILISGFIIAFLGSLKIYPFLGIYAVLKSTKSRSNQILILTASTFGGLLIIKEIEFISNRSITTWNSSSYGMSILPLMLLQRLGFEEPRIVSALIGLVFLLAVSVVLNFFVGKQIYKKAKLLHENYQDVGSFNMFVSVFVFSYLMGTSYDYRLVITFPIFMALYYVSENSSEKFIVFFLMLSIMYGGDLPFKLSTMGLVFNTISDAIIMVFTSLILLLLFDLNRRKSVRFK